MSAADTQFEGVKQLPRFECTVKICASAHMRNGSLPGNGAVFPGAFEWSMLARH
jgi:hypothetical protein